MKPHLIRTRLDQDGYDYQATSRTCRVTGDQYTNFSVDFGDNTAIITVSELSPGFGRGSGFTKAFAQVFGPSGVPETVSVERLFEILETYVCKA